MSFMQSIGRKTGTMNPLYAQILFVIIAFALMSVSSSLFVNNMLKKHLKRNAEEMLTQTQAQIDAYFMEPETVLLTISKTIRDIITQGGDTRAVRIYMNEISDNLEKKTMGYEFAGFYCYLEIAGGVYFPSLNWEVSDGFFIIEESPWYKAAVQAKGEIAASPVFFDIRLNDYVVTLSYQIFDNDGEPLGVTALNVPLSHLRDFVVDTRLSEGGYGFLMNEQFEVIAHVNQNEVGKSLFKVNPRLLKILPDLEQGIGISGFETKNSLGVESIFFFRKLENGWYLGLATLKNEYYLELTEMTIIVSVLGIIMAAALIIVLMSIDEARIKADEANRQKSNFLANMSHELRTPLNVVIGLTDMVLEESDLSEHVTENLLKISNAGSTLLSLVNDLLDFSKIESEKLVLAPVIYHMSSLLNDVITLVNTRIAEKPITFSLKIKDDLTGRLCGDDLRVKQILINLLSNAIKYTNKGTVELSVDCKREDTDGIRMEIIVSDTGIGIREEELKNLFQDYYQVDSRANRKIEGTGLGLSITKKLVEMMDGSINVESKYGAGSSFRVTIRQGYVSDTPIGRAVADNLRHFTYTDDKRLITEKLVRPNLDYAKVLVVDDMRTNLDVAAGLLRKYRMQVDCVTSGQEAIDRIRKKAPLYNAVFMDHMMPGMDGIETTDTIRAINTEYAKNVPVIALTANAIQGTEELFYQHGFQAFISKPIDIMQMDAVVKKWVRDDDRLKDDKSGAEVPEIVEEEEIMIDIPGIDAEKGLALYGDEADMFLLVLRSYADNMPAALNKLRDVTAETLADYAIAAHGIKGTSANVGAEAAREAALELEKLAKANDLEGVKERNDKFIKETEALVANIRVWLEENDGH